MKRATYLMGLLAIGLFCIGGIAGATVTTRVFMRANQVRDFQIAHQLATAVHDQACIERSQVSDSILTAYLRSHASSETAKQTDYSEYQLRSLWARMRELRGETSSAGSEWTEAQRACEQTNMKDCSIQNLRLIADVSCGRSSPEKPTVRP